MIRLRLVLWSISRFFITPAAVVGTRVPPAKSADFAELAPLLRSTWYTAILGLGGQRVGPRRTSTISPSICYRSG